METQIQEASHVRNANKRKRDSPGLNGRTRRQPHSPDGLQQDTNSVNDVHQNYYPEQNGNAYTAVRDEVARRIADSTSSATATAAALAASMPHMIVPQPTELSFQTTNSGNEDERPLGSSFDMGPENSHSHADGSPYTIGAYTGTNGEQAQALASGTTEKPAVGTDEWHKVRKDNHKEVERRRRETINEGINELAKIVPGCDKNKGAVLQRSVQYIGQLKENETKNIEKWTLEKMLTDQAIQDLSSSVEKLKEDNRKLSRDNDRWKMLAQSAGVNITAEEAGMEHDGSR